MCCMRKSRGEAMELRKSGKSYKEIRNALKIPLSTLSNWFGEQEWSRKIRTRLTASSRKGSRVHMQKLNCIRGIELEKSYENARREAQDELRVLKYHPVFVAGVMLYWGEGDKASWSGVRMSNTDPQLLKLFVTFLHDICGLETKDIKASVLTTQALMKKHVEPIGQRVLTCPLRILQKVYKYWENIKQSVWNMVSA